MMLLYRDHLLGLLSGKTVAHVARGLPLPGRAFAPLLPAAGVPQARREATPQRQLQFPRTVSSKSPFAPSARVSPQGSQLRCISAARPSEACESPSDGGAEDEDHGWRDQPPFEMRPSRFSFLKSNDPCVQFCRCRYCFVPGGVEKALGFSGYCPMGPGLLGSPRLLDLIFEG
jgi:hypothetical protein